VRVHFSFSASDQWPVASDQFTNWEI
jgi:hypothetical protein